MADPVEERARTGSGTWAGTSRFEIVKKLGAGGMGVVYEAYDRERGNVVALKTLLQMDATALYRFKQEFRALAELRHENLIELYELVGEGDHWFFTMELVENPADFLTYFAGDEAAAVSGLVARGDTADTSRDELLPHGGPTLGDTSVMAGDAPAPATEDLPVAALGRVELGWTKPTIRTRPSFDFARARRAFLELAEGVEALHRAGKLHRDLKPGNVLVRGDGRVVLLDFGLIAELDQPARPSAIGSDPPQSSQRQYHSTDPRIEGTVAYMAPEQAAAQPLTRASDWYAVGVMLFQALTGELPIRGNVERLLADKRRLDAPAPRELVVGVPDDLNDLCVRLLKRDPAARPTGAEVLACLRGTTAAAEPLSAAALPFVGREKELAELSRAFTEMLPGKAVVCHVHGKSGAGKSALVENFLGTLNAGSVALVLRGRCYEQESVPYKAVDSLMDSLTRHLLHLPESELAQVLPSDRSALGRIFPVLRRIETVASAVLTDADAPDLRELRQRAFVALRELFRRLGDRAPLVAYVDDLQWGDVDSAALLEALLAQPQAPRLLLLIAYRSEYVETSPCLRALAETEAAAKSAWRRVVVDALSPAEIEELVLSLVGRDDADARAQAAWVATESGGSPFFVYELVRHLEAGRDRADAQGLELDRVLWNRVTRLGADARRLLELVAVAGKPLTLRHMQRAAGLESIPPPMVAALRSDHLVRTTGPHLDDAIEAFHDRVRESVVLHLPPEALTSYHASLAQALEAEGTDDPEALAVHFRGAGEFAKASGYYAKAAARAIEVLAFERAQGLYELAAELSSSPEERALVYEKMTHFFTDMTRFREAYEIGRRGAALLGVKLPAGFVPPLFLVDFLKSKWLLRGRRAKDLLELPVMSDRRLTAAVRLINAVAKAAYQIRPELCVAVATKSVNLCLRYGNTRDAAIGYMVYGAIFQGAVLGRHRVGYEFGRFVLDLIEKHENSAQRPEVSFVVGYFGTSWLKPATEAEALWRVAYQAGREVRDLFHTGCACAGMIMSYHMRGVPMDEVWQESEKNLAFLERAGLREPALVLASVRQFVKNTRGQTRAPDSLSDDGFDEEAYAKELDGFGSRHFAHFCLVLKAQSLYLHGRHEAALTQIEKAGILLKDSSGMLHGAEHQLYRALILAALDARRGPFARWRGRRALRGTARRFSRWAELCPENFAHKARLLLGEVERLAGRAGKARQAYAEAATSARQHGYLQIEALACQRQAELCDGSEPAERERLLAESESAYTRWGATALVPAR